MSDQANTTNAPAAPAAPAPAPQQGVPQNLVSLDAIWRKTVAEPAEARLRGETPHDPAQTKPEPAKTTEQSAKPQEATKTPDRRFKLTPQKEETKPAAEQQQQATEQSKPDPLETIEADSGVSEASKVNFGKLREAYKGSKAEIAKWRSEAEARAKEIEALKTQKTATPPTADYEATIAENKRLAEQLARVDYANSPEFVSKYKAPQESSLAEAAEVLAYNDKKADLRGLLGKTPKELNASLADITKGMNPVDQATVINAVRQAAKLEQGAQEALKNAKANVETQSQRALYQSKTAFEQSWNETGLSQHLQKHEIPASADADTKAFLEQYNNGVDSIKANAEKYAFGALAPREAASVAQKAALADFYTSSAMPAVERYINSIAAERDAALKELSSLKAARNPGIPTGDNSGSGQVKATSLEDLWQQTVSSKR